MAWPDAATKANLDSAADDPSQARAELADLVDKFNILRENAAPGYYPTFTGPVIITNEINHGYKSGAIVSGELDVSGSSFIVVSSGSTVNYFTNFTTRQFFFLLNVTGATLTIKATAGNWSEFTIPSAQAACFIEYGGGLYRVV